MKRLTAAILCIIMVLTLTACGGGSGDALKGTWSGEHSDYGTVTWKFDGKGKCEMENDFFQGDGTYTIDGEQVTIKMELWDNEVVYDFSISGKSLNLTATDELAPEYENLTKK